MGSCSRSHVSHPRAGVRTDDKKHINAINGGLGIQETPRDCGKSLTLARSVVHDSMRLDLLTGQAQCLGAEVERAPQKDPRLPDTGLQSDRCIDRLNPHSLAVFGALRVTEECGERSPPRRG